jgi:SPP1 family predicted phage head-tail adaptor
MINNYFKPGFKVQSSINANKGGGSYSPSYSSDVATISGRMRQLSGSEMMKNERMNYITTHRFYCVFTKVIDATSRIVDKAGLIYDVKLVTNPMNMNRHLEVDCELKQ